MKIISVMNEKGGIGKTMTAAAIAYILGEEKGFRVLVVDADQQGNISALYRQYAPEGIGMSELMEKHRAAGGIYSTADVTKTTQYSHIDIIPSNGYLMRTNMNLLLNTNSDQISRFAAAMQEIEGAYDFVIADCGLVLDMTVTNVLLASDLIVLPVKLGGFETQSALNMMEQLEDMRSINPEIKAKVLMTMKQKNKTSDQMEQWLHEEFGWDCFRTAVRRSVVAEKSTIARKPLPKYSKNCTASQDYRQLTEELLKEMEG